MVERKIRFLVLSGVLYCVSWPLTLLALPAGEQVTHGNVHFERKEGHLKVHASDGSIVNYNSFDVARHEKIEFIQPSSSARILNRIQSSSPSKIDGKLRANGRVYLMNPAGIIFGPHAIIEVGRLFAAAARMRDEDFLQKRDRFYDIQGDVTNLGYLKGDEIHLIGNKVDNQGQIDAPQGFVSILSGTTVMIGEKDGHCFVVVDQESKPAQGIGATDLIGLAINNKGKIAANEVHIEGGDQSKLQIEGVILAKGEQGGTVKILGDQITLKALEIDATGELGGGTVLVGGDYQGSGDFRRATLTQMDVDAKIDVSALKLGDGGKAILWSDGTTLFDGQILSRGGLEGGNGGLIETSGKISLGCWKGRVDALAPHGKAGDWLLDPTTLVIATGGAATLVQATNCGLVGQFTIDPVTINPAAANVILCAQGGTITHNAGEVINMVNIGIGLSYKSDTGTILQTNASVTTNNGVINFEDTGTVQIDNGVVLNSGTAATTFTNTNSVGIGFGASTVMIVNGFDSSVGPTQTNLSGNILVTNFGANVAMGTVTILSPVTLSTNVGSITSGPISSPNDLTMTTLGGNIITGGINIFAPRTLTIDAGAAGTVLISSIINNSFVLNNSASTAITGVTTLSNVTLNNTVGAVTFNGTVAVSTSFTTTPQGYSVVFVTGGTITPATTFFNTGGVFLGTNAASNITFTNGINTNQPGVTTHTFGTVNTTGTTMSYGPVILTGNTTMNTASGALTFHSTLTGARNLILNTGTTAPLFVGSVSIGDVVGNTSLTITTTGANTIFQNTLTTVGGLTSNNNLVFNNNVSIGGVVNIPSLTTNLIPLPTYNIAFLGGGTITAFTNFFNVGTVTFGSPTFPVLNFTNGVSTLSGPTMTIIQGTVNATAAGAPMTFGPTTFNPGNSFLNTNNGLMNIGDVTLTGSSTLTTSGANMTIGNVSGPGSISTSSGATGNTTITSLNCNTFTPSNSLSATVTGTTTAGTINLTGMAAGQSVVFNGLVNISTAFFTSPAAYSVAFNAGGTVTPFTNFFNTGGVFFGNSASSSITFTNGFNTFFPGVVTHTFGNVLTTLGNMTFGTLILDGNTSLDTTINNITFESTINGNFTLFVVAPGGIATFNGVVGGITPLGILDITASSILINANMTAQGGTLIYNGPVLLGVNTVLTDTGNIGILFLNTLDGANTLTLNANANVSASGVVGGITPLRALTVNAGGSTTFANNVFTSGTPGLIGGNITIASGGPVRCNGTLFARGGPSLGANGFDGGDVTISSIGNSIFIQSIDVSGSNGIGFVGGDSGSITLQPAAGFSSGGLGNIPQGLLVINGSLTALGGAGAVNGLSGNVSLSPAGRTTTMSVATITGNPAGSNLTISSANLTMGQNEAMTILGNGLFNIEQTATLGDVVALDNLTVNATTLQFLRHPAGQILNYQGILYTNHGVHLISRGTTVNASSIVDIGEGPSSRIQTISKISRSFFRKNLFFGSTVLNFDGEVPVSGIVDWVLPADTTWDTVPLPDEQICWKQILAQRLDRTTEMIPDLRAKWLWLLDRTDCCNPVDEALASYMEMKGHGGQIFSMPDFARYLAEFHGSGNARQYIGKVRAILNQANHQPTMSKQSIVKKLKQFLLIEKEEKAVPYLKLLSPSAAFYFSEDIFEYTKPCSLSDDQWRQLLGE